MLNDEYAWYPSWYFYSHYWLDCCSQKIRWIFWYKKHQQKIPSWTISGHWYLMFWAAGSSTWREAHVGGRVWCWSGSLEKPWNCTDLGKQGLRNPWSMGMIGIYQYELAKSLGMSYLLDPFWLFVGSCCCFLGGTFWNALAHGYVPISCDNFRGQGSSCHRIVVTIPWPGELAAWPMEPRLTNMCLF
jgi:hypothetical protein